ncbi:MAG: hypothetical protein AB2792_19950 [Candidatus Thiodiazotropha sp.]
MNPHNRVIILRMNPDQHWKVQTNPSWSSSEHHCNQLLHNDANDYVEYQNCGVKHRMIRFRDLGQYDIKKSEVKPEWLLDPTGS